MYNQILWPCCSKLSNLSKSMGKLLSDADERQLVELWSRRSNLAGKDLERLCLLVMQVLQRCNAPELQALREGEDLRDTRERYIHDFLLAKVLDTERYSDQGRLDSAGVLVSWFRKLLLNAIASKQDSILRDSCDLDESRQDDSPNETLSHTSPECVLAANPHSTAHRWLEHARQFANGLESRYQILLLSYCADEAVFTVAKRYNIASAAHHAGKLGITKKHGDAPPDFEKTLIGSWIKNVLRIPFDRLHIHEVLEVFEALCAASFELRKQFDERLQNA